MNNDSIWLSDLDVKILTARTVKSLQIEQLRKMGIQFYINASGRPVVPKSAVEGGEIVQQKQKWQPNGLRK